MNEELKTFLENNKELVRENRWCELYDKAFGEMLPDKLSNFLYKGLGQETMLDCFAEEGKIPNCAFQYCDSLTSITIPDSVTSIGDEVFAGCRSLTSVEFDKPSSVTSISADAFKYCKSLKSITIPDSVTTIGKYAFGWCTSLPEITIPDSVTSIDYGAFEGCTRLPEITIPKSVTSISKWAFYDCTCHIIFKCDKGVVTKDSLNGFKGTYEFK